MSSIPQFSSLVVEQPDPVQLANASVKRLEKWDQTASLSESLELIREWQQDRAEYQTRASLAYARLALDTENETAKADKYFFDQLAPDVKEQNLKMIRRLLSSEHRTVLESHFGSHIFATWDLETQTFAPRIGDEERSISELVNRYSELMAAIRIDFEGQEWTYSTIRSRTGDSSRSVREGAQRAIHEATLPHQEELDSLYDQLTTLRAEMGRKMGHDSFTPLGYARMGRTDYGPSEVEIFRAQVREELVPLCSRIYQRRTRALGLDSLRFWDESVRDRQGEPRPKGDRAWMVDRASEMFDQMGGDFGPFFRMMRNHELMDLDSRPGKKGGGFCMDLPTHRVPFIFANFVGTQADVKVFTHECGHAYQNWQASRVQPLLEYRWPTSEAAEIHSMALEFLTHPYMELFFQEDADRFRESHLEQSLLFIPYGCAVDHFQHMVYAEPSASPNDRAAMWKECERLYLPHRNYGGLSYLESGRFWQRQRHIYRYPFYYIDYCLAQTVALQFWHRARLDRTKTMEEYEELCRQGGSMPFTGLLKHVGFENPFESGTLESVVRTAADVLDLT